MPVRYFYFKLQMLSMLNINNNSEAFVVKPYNGLELYK